MRVDKRCEATKVIGSQRDPAGWVIEDLLDHQGVYIDQARLEEVEAEHSQLLVLGGG